jgi:hypothetical protein
MFRSGFAPRILYVLLMLGGLFYVLAFVGPVFNPEYETPFSGGSSAFPAASPA